LSVYRLKTAFFVHFFSLRQHYLDQVLRVDEQSVVLSAGLTQLPMHLITKKALFIFKTD